MHYKQNNKETKTYVQGLRLFGKTLPKSIRSILKKRGYNYSEIVSKWSTLVGKKISGCSYPKSIRREKDKTTLIVAIRRGDEITIEYSKNDIVNKINAYFGYKLIDEVRSQLLNEGEKEKKIKKNQSNINFSDDLTKKINQIENEKIKNSLSELFKVIKNG